MRARKRADTTRAILDSGFSHAASQPKHQSMKTYKLITAVSISAAAAFTTASLAQTEAVWQGGSGSWDDASQWSTHPVFPSGSSYDARIDSGSVGSNEAVSELNELILTGGTLSMEGEPLNLVGGFTWSGGGLSEDEYDDFINEITIASTGNSAWSGALDWQGAIVTNDGNMTFADGIEVILNAGYGVSTGLVNSGSVTLLNGGSWKGNWYGEGSEPPGFTNTNNGTVVKQGAGTFLFDENSDYSPAMPFTNNGIIDVQAGTLEIRSSLDGSGTWEVAADAHLILHRGFSNDGSVGTYVGAVGSTISIFNGSVGTSADFSGFSGLLAVAGTVFLESNELPNLQFGNASTSSRIIVNPASSTLTVENLAVFADTQVEVAVNHSLRVTEHLTLNGMDFSVGGPNDPEAGALELALGATGTVNGVNTMTRASLEVDGSLDIADGGTLSLNIGSLSGSGTLLIEDGGALVLNPSTTTNADVTVKDVSIATDPGGVVRIGPGRNSLANQGNVIFDNASFDGTLAFESDFSVLELRNGTTVSGALNFNNPTAGDLSALIVVQNWTTGNLTLSDTSVDVSSAAGLIVQGTHTVTLSPNTALLNLSYINGDFFESISDNPVDTGHATLINQGLIRADVDGMITSFGNTDTFINEGEIEVSNGASIDIDREFTQTSGTILIGAGSMFEMTDPTYHASTRTLTLEGGSLEGHGEFAGNIDLEGGTISPGSSPGLLTIDGDLYALSGSLFFELGGTGRGTEFDALDVTETFTLNGSASLLLSFIDSFENTITSSQTFTLIQAGTLTGTFADIANGDRILTSDGFGSFQVNYGSGSAFAANHVVLSGYQAIPEPSMAAAVAAFCLAMALRRRRSSTRIS